MQGNEGQTKDSELILMARAGNDDALKQLFARHLNFVYAICLKYTGNQEDAEDATQETFLKIWRHLKKIDLEKSFRAWMAEIAKNTCLDAIKRRRAIPLSAFDDEDGNNHLADSIPSSEPLPDDHAEQSLLSDTLNRAMEKMTPAYQTVLSMYYRDGMNFREISEKLNEPLHTIKSRHRRAVINLRTILKRN